MVPLVLVSVNVRFPPIADIAAQPQKEGMANWMDRLRSKLADPMARHDRVPDDIREQLPLAAIEKVVFFKIDELATDLICVEVEASGTVWFFHEEAEGWKTFISYLEQLPGFRSDWYQAVVLPPFAASATTAYLKA
jgi:hypothetical protein